MTSRSSPQGAFRRTLSRILGALGPGDAGSGEREAPVRTRRAWFYRQYGRLTGGHLKHSHYFHHVLRMPGFAPVIAFGEEPRNVAHARERGRLWPAGADGAAARWEPERGDLLFLEGASDWPYLFEHGLDTLPVPRINLIQGVRHAREDDVRYRYLAERAIRICVSREVADAISATGRTNGPVLTIPNGIDVTSFEPVAEGAPAGYETRRHSVVIVGYKRLDLARELSQRLGAAQIEHRLLTEFLDREAFLALLAETRIAVCLPLKVEGFYLPALEAMASGCLVVTLDCIGNRSFCHRDANCLVAEPTCESLYGATGRALAMPPRDRARLHRRARDTAVRHSLDAERERFHAVLADVDRLWKTG